jgi:hypothetical protein
MTRTLTLNGVTVTLTEEQAQRVIAELSAPAAPPSPWSLVDNQYVYLTLDPKQVEEALDDWKDNTRMSIQVCFAPNEPVHVCALTRGPLEVTIGPDEAAAKLLDPVVLQQEAGLAVVEVGHAAAVGSHREAQVAVEALGPLEVPGRHEGLGFDGAQRGHVRGPGAVRH